MVRWWKYTKAFFRLVRLPNLLIIAFTMYLLRWLVVLPILDSMDFSPGLTELHFLLLTLATLCIAGGGYVINDYFDRKADLINRPGKVILGRILSRRTGMVWHMVLTFCGVILGMAFSYKIGHWKLGVVFVFISGLLWFYSTSYKKQVLLGNLVVAFMIASVPMIILLFEMPLLIEHYNDILYSDSSALRYLFIWILGYSVFAFILTLIREIVKDLEDFEGDFAFGRQTIPIAWGSKVARIICLSLSVVTIVLLSFIVFYYLNDAITIVYSLPVIVFPLILFMYIFYRSDSKSHYHKSSTLLKLIMLGGLGYMLVAYFFIF